MFARFPAYVIPRTRQVIGTKKTVITISFTGSKCIALDSLPKETNSTGHILSATFFPI
jgi:hypothetical protein